MKASIMAWCIVLFAIAGLNAAGFIITANPATLWAAVMMFGTGIAAAITGAAEYIKKG